MLFVLLIHVTVLLKVTAQKNLTSFGQAALSSTYSEKTAAINAILPPISNAWNIDQKYCTHNADYQTNNSQPAWWKFEFSFESAYITEIQIYYRENFAHRMDGFKLYITNTSTIPPDGFLCYEDPDPGLPNITQTIPCYQLGKYVIYYDTKGEQYFGPIIELCYVAIYGCPKSRWGGTCQEFCPANCIEKNCFPENGSCVWGCKPKNCLYDICDKDTAVCIVGCEGRRTGSFCDKYNIAYDGVVWQTPSGTQQAGLAKDGHKKTCSKTLGSSVTFQVDLKEESIVTGVYINLGEYTTKEGHHTIYASKNSNTWRSGTVLYNGTFLSTEISFEAVFRFLTYVPPVQIPFTELELCEIGIIGCPPTHYGPLCNTTCPHNCNGPCDLDVGNCIFGCKDGWTGDLCDKACDDGYFGDNCTEKCNCLTGICNSFTGKCSEDESQSRSEETSNAAAIGGGVAAFIIVVLIIVAAFILYRRRCISTQDGVRTKSSDTTTYDNRNTTNNSHRNEQHYDDLIRMETNSSYQDLTTPSVSNEYEQIE